MEEELQKRNTDCVYFLASPLTCKKGIDCEYRHSETARLNPRDCWYWMAGSCLNPTCAFRHPPLDGHPETASESAVSDHQTAAPVNKPNVPCYFYFNGYCNKGERCSYLHGPDEMVHTWKSSKTASAAVNGPSSEKKTSLCSDLVPASVETQSFETVPKRTAAIKIKPEQELHQSPSDKIAELCASPCEEVAAIRSSSPIHEETFVQSRYQESAGQSSDDQQLDPIGREEWLESSPGFDVLVNDRSEDFDYKDIIEYDPAYPDLRISFGQEVHDSFHHVDDEVIHNPITKFRFWDTEEILDRTLQRKRTLCQAELGSKGVSGADLRDYLKKRRVINAQYPTYSQIRERPHRSSGHLHGKLASKVEVYSVGSRIQNKTLSNHNYKPARSRHSRVSRSRHHFKQNRPYDLQNRLPELSGKMASRKQISAKVPTLFTGPKTLAQIKDEKRKAQENGGISAIEQGPK